MENLSIDQDQDDIIIKCGLEEMAKAFFKDFEIIWHDPNVNSQENQQYLTQLQTLCQVKTFIEWKEAESYIKTAKTVCHVITSGTNGELLVKEIFSSQNVPKILTFCRNEEYHSTWSKDYEKVLCTETRFENVISQIQENLQEWSQQISFLKSEFPSFAPIFDDRDKTTMNHLHLYLKMIPNFNNRAQAKKDFASLSKKLYSGRSRYEKSIADFEGTYNEYDMKAILKWYTKPTFLHKVINNSLRIATSDSIQYCRLVLRDIERAIKDQYQAKSKSFSGLLYRGAYLSEEEWSSLKANVNREIEMHGFLSASKDEKIAWKFISGNFKKIFITIIVPKGPNEEEQGFAEVEEFSHLQNEKEILFNVRSRFTVLETQDQYSRDLPYRHLVLLYGAQSLRKFIAEKNPVHQISIESIGTISCSGCKVSISETTEKMLVVPLIDSEKRIYSCVKCLHDDTTATPFLCVSAWNIREKFSPIKVKGCLLMHSSQTQIPLYGYECSKCGGKSQKRYLVCTDCGEKEKKWCENCFGKEPHCIEAGHSVILENYPFSFWCEKMSEAELNHLKYHNDLVEDHNHIFRQARMYLETHKYEKAIEFFNRCIVQNGWSGIEELIYSYSGLGEAYFKQREYMKALEHCFKALNIKKSLYGDNHLDLATSYNNIGSIYLYQAEYMKALESYFKSLDIKKATHGEKHPHVAQDYSHIGSVYAKQGEYTKALEYHFKCLDISRSIHGNHHPDVAMAYNNIGFVYDRQGEYFKSPEYHLKCLDISKSFYGENDPHVAASYNNLGSAYERQGEHMKALEYYMKSLDIRKLILGENHPDIAIAYTSIGSIFRIQGETMKALEYQLKSLDIYKAAHGENHPDIAVFSHNIGLVYDRQGEYTKALEYYFKSLDIEKSVHGESHLDVAGSCHNIGSVYEKQGEYMKALEYYLKMLNIRKLILGESHPDVAIAYANIGRVSFKQQEYIKAIEYHFKCLDICKSVHGENHPGVAGSYYNIGLVYIKQGEYTKALEFHLKCLEIRKSVCGENHSDVAGSYKTIGLVFEIQGEFVKALEYYLKSLDIYKLIYGESHLSTTELQNKICEIESMNQSN